MLASEGVEVETVTGQHEADMLACRSAGPALSACEQATHIWACRRVTDRVGELIVPVLRRSSHPCLTVLEYPIL
jgi:hypothetical protein